jgi:serine/threonine protein kinase
MIDDKRLLDLARRLLAGEAIDWEKEGIAEAEVREGMKRLQRLLEKSGDATDTADAPPPEPPAPPPPPPPPRSREDRYVGDFRLVRKLGEGGMGVVYEAEQQHPRRPVALKVIRGGAHVSPDTLKLFQRESSTLARLRHPGIAALYETGATEDGLHFFAMELVRGSTLTAWLGKRPAGPMTPEELKLRLSVFKKICDAVAYAHQRGVIHRDLKPANVLIPKTTESSSIQDAVPDIKVLDFGLARITDSDVQATTYVTEMGKVQGTLPYMSPEQVRGNPDEIDLRADVYSLGVMLYEMVTGCLPYDLSKAQIPEAVRIICEEAPKSISATFTGTKRLDADVITIAAKCLEKEASRRYQSAAQLGEDVQRYLSDQPILARSPSTLYQLRKLAARHKGAFAFAATVFVLVTALAVTSTIQAFRISKERDRANQEAETAKQVSEFLEGLFRVSDPSEARGNTITAREILDSGAERIERELKGQDAVQAPLMLTMGQVYEGLGLPAKAEPLLRGSLERRQRIFGENSYEAAESMSALGWFLAQHGSRSEALDLQTRAMATASDLLDAHDPRLAWIRYRFGVALYFHNRLDKARSQLETALAVFRDPKTEDIRGQIWCLNDLANTAGDAGDRPRALAYQEEALAIRRSRLPPNHPDLAIGLGNTAEALMYVGRLDQARRLAEEAVALSEKVNGPEHGVTGFFLQTLSEIQRRDGDLRAAERGTVRALPLCEKYFGPSSTHVAEVLLTRAQVERDLGRLADSEATFRKLFNILEDTSREGGPARLAAALREYVVLLKKLGRAVAEAEARIRLLEANKGRP